MSSEEQSSSPTENETPENYREAFQGREIYTKYTDPCEQASKAAMACLDRNNYDHAKCNDFFQTYRDCKKTWIDQRREDRKKGIR